MKLKSKLIGILGTAVVATTALTTVIGCKYEDTVTNNGVRYNGTRKISTSSGVRTAQIDGFKLWRDLRADKGEAIKITSSNPDIKASIVADFTQSKSFAVNITANIADYQLNQSFDFDLTFTFYENSKQAGQSTISAFKFDYLSVWTKKWVELVGSKTLITEPGQVKFNATTLFKLNNNNILGEGEKLVVRVDEAHAQNFACEITSTNDVISFNLTCTNIPDKYADYTVNGIDFVFEIWYGNEIKWSSETSESADDFKGFSYQYKKDWPELSIDYSGFEDTTIITTVAGEKVVTLEPTATQKFELSRDLEQTAGEKETLERIECSNKQLQISNIQQSGRTIIPTFTIEPNSSVFDFYKAKDYNTTLTFVFSKQGFQNERSIYVYNRTFTIHYTPLDKPDEYGFTMDKQFISLKGEKLMTVAGFVYIPEGYDVPTVTISGAKKWTGTNGGTIELHDGHSFESYAEYNFVSFFLDISPNGDYIEDDFVVSFDVSLQSAQHTTNVPVSFNVHYTPYSHANEMKDPYEYMADRSLTLMCAHDNGSESASTDDYEYETATGWIIGQNPNNANEYYVATRWSDKIAFEDMANSAYGTDTYHYHIGIGDDSMSTQTETGSYNILNEDYMFLKKEAVTYISNATSDSTNYFIVDEGAYIGGNGHFGTELNVLTIDISKPTEGEYRNFEHTRDITNKVERLKAYRQDKGEGGKLTDLWIHPVANTSDWEANGYKCYLAGFGQIKVPYYGMTLDAPYWDQISIDTSLLSYSNAGTNPFSDSTYIMTNVIHRPCYYEYNANVSSSGWFDGHGFGSMLLLQDTNNGGFYVAGIYSGDSRDSTVRRWFDVFSWDAFTWSAFLIQHNVAARNMLEAWNN